MKYIQELGFIQLRCVLTTLGDREVRTTRAKFTRSVLDDLGISRATVGVGVDYPIEVHDTSGAVDVKATQGRTKDHRVFVETPLLKSDAVVEMNGTALAVKELERIEDHKAVFLVNAGMVDLAQLLADVPELVQRKTKRIVVIGRIEPSLDDRGFVVADTRAYNNTMHQSSADYTYRRSQELGIPLVVVNKEATYRVAVPRSFYDNIAATRHPIGIYLKNQQKEYQR